MSSRTVFLNERVFEVALLWDALFQVTEGQTGPRLGHTPWLQPGGTPVCHTEASS